MPTRMGAAWPRCALAKTDDRSGSSRQRNRDRARLTAVRDAAVRYVERDGGHLAFSVFGEGPNDLAITQGRFPIDLMWELPQLAAFMESLGRLARVIVWDQRGYGASDPIHDADVARTELFVDAAWPRSRQRL